MLQIFWIIRIPGIYDLLWLKCLECSQEEKCAILAIAAKLEKNTSANQSHHN